MAADAIRAGMDPDKVIDRGKEDFLINYAILKKIAQDRAEEKHEELLALSKYIASELATILGAMFR